MNVPRPIQTPADNPYHEIRTTLSGRDFVIQLDYSEREDRWYLHLYDANREPLMTGKKLVTNWPMGRARHADPRTPPGFLIAYSAEGLEALPPSFSDLGRRVWLGYIEP